MNRKERAPPMNDLGCKPQRHILDKLSTPGAFDESARPRGTKACAASAKGNDSLTDTTSNATVPRGRRQLTIDEAWQSPRANQRASPAAPAVRTPKGVETEGTPKTAAPKARRCLNVTTPPSSPPRPAPAHAAERSPDPHPATGRGRCRPPAAAGVAGRGLSAGDSAGPRAAGNSVAQDPDRPPRRRPTNVKSLGPQAAAEALGRRLRPEEGQDESVGTPREELQLVAEEEVRLNKGEEGVDPDGRGRTAPGSRKVRQQRHQLQGEEHRRREQHQQKLGSDRDSQHPLKPSSKKLDREAQEQLPTLQRVGAQEPGVRCRRVGSGNHERWDRSKGRSKDERGERGLSDGDAGADSGAGVSGDGAGEDLANVNAGVGDDQSSGDEHEVEAQAEAQQAAAAAAAEDLEDKPDAGDGFDHDEDDDDSDDGDLELADGTDEEARGRRWTGPHNVATPPLPASPLAAQRPAFGPPGLAQAGASPAVVACGAAGGGGRPKRAAAIAATKRIQMQGQLQPQLGLQVPPAPVPVALESRSGTSSGSGSGSGSGFKPSGASRYSAAAAQVDADQPSEVWTREEGGLRGAKASGGGGGGGGCRRALSSRRRVRADGRGLPAPGSDKADEAGCSVVALGDTESSGLATGSHGNDDEEEEDAAAARAVRQPPQWDEQRPGYVHLRQVVAYRSACDRAGHSGAKLPRAWGVGLLGRNPVYGNIMLHGEAATLAMAAIEAALQGKLGDLNSMPLVEVAVDSEGPYNLKPEQVRGIRKQLERKLREGAWRRMREAGVEMPEKAEGVTNAQVLRHFPEIIPLSRKVECVRIGEAPDPSPWDDVAAMRGQWSLRVKPDCTVKGGELVGLYSSEGWLHPDWERLMASHPVDEWDDPDHPCPYSCIAARKHTFGRYAATCQVPEAVLENHKKLGLPHGLSLLLGSGVSAHGNLYVTAARLGCEVSYANDPRRNLEARCEAEADFREGGPNATVVTAEVLGLLPLISMVAIKNLPGKKHVTYNYGMDYWQLHREEEAAWREAEALMGRERAERQAREAAQQQLHKMDAKLAQRKAALRAERRARRALEMEVAALKEELRKAAEAEAAGQGQPRQHPSPPPQQQRQQEQEPTADHTTEMFYSPAATHGPTSAAATPSPATVWHSGSAGLGTPLQDATAAVTPGAEEEERRHMGRTEERRPMGRHVLGSPLGKRSRGVLNGGVGAAGSPYSYVLPAVEHVPADVLELYDAFSPPGLLLQLQSPDGDAGRTHPTPTPWPGGHHPTPKSASTPPSQRHCGRISLPKYRPRELEGGDVGASVTASPSAEAAAAAPGPAEPSGRGTPLAGAAGPTGPRAREAPPAAAIAHGDAGDGDGSGDGAEAAAGAGTAAVGTPDGGGAGRSPWERAVVNTRLMRLNTKFQRQQRRSLAEARLAVAASGAGGGGAPAAVGGEGLGSRHVGGAAGLCSTVGGAAAAPQQPQQGQLEQEQEQQQEQGLEQGLEQQQQGQRQPPQQEQQQQQRAPVVVTLSDDELPARRQPALPRRRPAIPVVIDLVDDSD